MSFARDRDAGVHSRSKLFEPVESRLLAGLETGAPVVIVVEDNIQPVAALDIEAVVGILAEAVRNLEDSHTAVDMQVDTMALRP